MANFFISNNETVAPFAGGIAGTAARNLVYRVVFSPAWLAGDRFIFNIITSAQTIVVGAGALTKVVPTMAVTLNDRVHFLSGVTWYGSDNGDASAWEQQAAGAFNINVANQWQEPENLVSLAPYQGRMAVFSQRTAQIWIIDPNPTNFTQQQVLSNIGTYCPLGPQSIGDLDVLFPSTTGIRSLRVRDSSLNAFVNDIGSPIDLNMQTAINASADLSVTCSIIEPSANRYWHFINGLIYVLSYFPAAKIMAAWSIYVPNYFIAGDAYIFIPSKFVTYKSIVYARAKSLYDALDHIFAYGGTGGTTYDATVATAATTWLDLRKPGTRKNAVALDYAMTGSWQFYASMDWQGVNGGAAMQAVTNAAVTAPSFQLGQFPLSDDGYHIKMKAVSSGSTAAVLSSLVFHYQTAEEK